MNAVYMLNIGVSVRALVVVNLLKKLPITAGGRTLTTEQNVRPGKEL